MEKKKESKSSISKNIKSVMTPKKSRSAAKPGLQAPKKLKIIVTICYRKRAELIESFINTYQSNLQMVFYGKGTTPPHLSKYLPNIGPERAVIVSFITEEKVKYILDKLENYYFKTKNGDGIAFAISLESLIGVQLYKNLANIKED